MSKEELISRMVSDLHALGIAEGDTLMVHSSYRSLGTKEIGADGVFCALQTALGPEGTLVIPAFSFDTIDWSHPVFVRNKTPTCVGYLPQYFFTKVKDVKRSMHPTHSCCVWGKRQKELIEGHELDLTPVGAHSPIMRLTEIGGKVLMLGCHPDHLTLMHGVEETVVPPYLYADQPVDFLLIDGDTQITQHARRHSFENGDIWYCQKYSRLLEMPDPPIYTTGKVLKADCVLYDAHSVLEKAHKKMTENPLYFVDIRKK